MLTIGGPGRIFLATGVTDMRKSFNGLYAEIQRELGADPLDGSVYVFCNRRRDLVKIFCFDSGGIWVCAKRLEAGTFRWPAAGERTVPLTATQLQCLLSGIDLTQTRQRRWWRRPEPQRQ